MNDKTEVNEVHGIKRNEIESLDRNAAFKLMIAVKGIEMDQASKVWAAFGTKNKGGVFQAFLDYCAEAPRTQSQLAAFVMSDKSSPNEVRWFNQRDSIRLLSTKVFVGLGVDFKEKAASKEQFEKMEKIVADVAKANKAKKAANK